MVGYGLNHMIQGPVWLHPSETDWKSESLTKQYPLDEEELLELEPLDDELELLELEPLEEEDDDELELLELEPPEEELLQGM